MITPVLAGSVSNFFDSVGEFFSSLASINWGWLLLGLVFFVVYLSIRAPG